MMETRHKAMIDSPRRSFRVSSGKICCDETLHGSRKETHASSPLGQSETSRGCKRSSSVPLLVGSSTSGERSIDVMAGDCSRAHRRSLRSSLGLGRCSIGHHRPRDETVLL